jgi:hypothetical protein
MRIAIAFALVLVAGAVAANPVAEELYVDFDPPNHVEVIYPAPYTTVEAYIVTEIPGYIGQDIYSISFDVEMLFGQAIITGDFVPAYPVYTVQITDNGITVIAPDCISGYQATLGYVPVFYIGMPDIVHIVPHAYAGHTFVTCGDMEEYDWCYVMDGGLGTAPGVYAYCGNPVEDVAWGVIKAMYR